MGGDVLAPCRRTASRDSSIEEAVEVNHYDESASMQTITSRIEAARQANRDDADLWRWFCGVYQEGRIRWCRSSECWFVSVDHKHLAIEPDFDAAIRNAFLEFRASSGRTSAS
jgi:glutamate-1-semialdehyde aminotransferase